MRNLFEIAYNVDSVHELVGRYVGYTKRNANELEYHEPENDEQLAKAKAVRKRVLTGFSAITAAFLIFTVLMAVTGNKLYLVAIMVIGTLVLAFMTLRLMRQTAQVTEGKVVLKHYDRKLGSKKKTYYFVTAAIDYPEKVICTRIPISKADYEKVKEGSPILLVKALNSCYACVL